MPLVPSSSPPFAHCSYWTTIELRSDFPTTGADCHETMKLLDCYPKIEKYFKNEAKRFADIQLAESLDSVLFSLQNSTKERLTWSSDFIFKHFESCVGLQLYILKSVYQQIYFNNCPPPLWYLLKNYHTLQIKAVN